jgi:hypothetical protein
MRLWTDHVGLERIESIVSSEAVRPEEDGRWESFGRRNPDAKENRERGIRRRINAIALEKSKKQDQIAKERPGNIVVSKY